MTTKVKPTVEGWDTSAKPDQTVVMITNSIFNAIGWAKHYTVKERQALNDVVDEIVSHSVQEAKAEMIEKIWTWAVDNGITDKKSFVALRDYLASLKQEEVQDES